MITIIDVIISSFCIKMILSGKTQETECAHDQSVNSSTTLCGGHCGTLVTTQCAKLGTLQSEFQSHFQYLLCDPAQVALHL